MQFESITLDSVLGWHRSSAFETSSRVMPEAAEATDHTFNINTFVDLPEVCLWLTCVGFLGSVSSVSLSQGRLTKRPMASGSEHIVLWSSQSALTGPVSLHSHSSPEAS